MKFSISLSLENRGYLWRRNYRSGLTMAKLLTIDRLRPDLLRMRRIHKEALVDKFTPAPE